MPRTNMKSAFKDTLPVMTGYLVLGFGFGMIMNSSGYGFLWSTAMSVFIYAGSMQYAAIGLLTNGTSMLTVALTTLAINARHLFYGISMIDSYKNAGKQKPYMIFALTDETYSLVCEKKDMDYCFFVSLFDHIYWITGTLIGSVLGNTFCIDTKGIDFALTALFITVFVDQWMNTQKHFPAISGIVISILCLIIFGADNFLIPAMITITVLLLIKMRWENVHDD